ncbi:MAG TPA: zf-HC2 domain-containing protein [Pyrinomonadaceae bacterium]|nr:zf-HC2 domain-containing protein [Pyrinomonadaceae bacterium]
MQEISGAQKCDRENDLITFLYGECNETEARNFEQHLRTCSVCESDLAGFNRVRKSMTAWRSEVLGVTETVKSSPIAMEPIVTRQRSAVAAIREFFNLSPLWLKGAVAFASILFCLFAALTIFNMRKQNKPSVASSDNTVYTEEELNSRVNQALAAAKEQFDKERVPQVQKESHNDQPAARHGDSAVVHNKKGQSRPLSRTERQQLAADLRLISSSDEPSLDLLGDRINQQE